MNERLACYHPASPISDFQSKARQKFLHNNEPSIFNQNGKKKRRLGSGIVTGLPHGKVLVVLTIWFWFGSLVYTHYKLNQVPLNAVDENNSNSLRRFAMDSSNLIRDASDKTMIKPRAPGGEPDTGDYTATLPSLPEQNNSIPAYLKAYMDHKQQHLTASSKSMSKHERQPKLLIFEGESLMGQGAGNLMR